jgi:cytochrome b561
VHWISAFVLLYAFISNGDTTNAMVNPVAMRGEVKLGLIVGLIFLIRLIWVQSRRSAGGRWVGPSVRIPQSKIKSITDWGIYAGVAASVASGLLIAYLRPGAQLVPTVRGFTTNSTFLNAIVDAHAFISDALEWLCGFHAAYALWHWAIKRTQWGRAAGDWIGRTAAATASRVATSRLAAKTFRT